VESEQGIVRLHVVDNKMTAERQTRYLYKIQMSKPLDFLLDEFSERKPEMQHLASNFRFAWKQLISCPEALPIKTVLSTLGAVKHGSCSMLPEDYIVGIQTHNPFPLVLLESRAFNSVTKREIRSLERAIHFSLTAHNVKGSDNPINCREWYFPNQCVLDQPLVKLSIQERFKNFQKCRKQVK
jgi:hypothetical protein